MSQDKILQLDPIVHAPVRLAILSILITVENAHFTFLKELTKTGPRVEKRLKKLAKKEKKAEGGPGFVAKLIEDEEETLGFLKTIEVELDKAIQMAKVIVPLSAFTEPIIKNPDFKSRLAFQIQMLEALIRRMAWQLHKGEILETGLLKLERSGVGILRAEAREEERGDLGKAERKTARKRKIIRRR